MYKVIPEKRTTWWSQTALEAGFRYLNSFIRRVGFFPADSLKLIGRVGKAHAALMQP